MWDKVLAPSGATLPFYHKYNTNNVRSTIEFKPPDEWIKRNMIITTSTTAIIYHKSCCLNVTILLLTEFCLICSGVQHWLSQTVRFVQNSEIHMIITDFSIIISNYNGFTPPSPQEELEWMLKNHRKCRCKNSKRVAVLGSVLFHLRKPPLLRSDF